MAAKRLGGIFVRPVAPLQMARIVCLSQQDGKWAVNWVMPPDLLDRKDRP